MTKNDNLFFTRFYLTYCLSILILLFYFVLLVIPPITYPAIFKAKDEKPTAESNQQTADNKRKKHTPFSQIITLMAADELRLLGNLHECQNTRLYDFLNAFLESKRVHDIRAKAMKR